MNQNLDPKIKETIFPSSLLSTPGFKKDEIEAEIKLDQNESPNDWPKELKEKILDELGKRSWNRYPEAYPKRLITALANYTQCSENQIIAGPGSNYILSVILNATCRQACQVVIARPSFPLYEAHLRYENIDYEPWLLNEELEYDLGTLPKLIPGSVLVFASPNNPVGNILKKKDLQTILEENPQTLVLADEAYLEYGNETFASLMSTFPNLIIIRTFSKTFGAASIRLGYALGHEGLITEIKKLVLPFVINPFTEIAITSILEDSSRVEEILDQAKAVVQARDKIFPNLLSLGEKIGFKVNQSYSNFFLLKCNTQDICDDLYTKLLERKILVRNVSKGPGMRGCLRLSVGSKSENQAVIDTLSSL